MSRSATFGGARRNQLAVFGASNVRVGYTWEVPLATLAEARHLIRRPLLAPSPLQRYVPGDFHVDLRDGLALASMGGDGPEENYIVVWDEIDPARILEIADDRFGAGGYAVIVESGSTDALIEFLDQQGWDLDEDEPALLLHPIPAPPAPPRELEIRVVNDQQSFDEFIMISETGTRWVPSLEAAMDPNVCLLVGYVNGRAMATSRLSCLGDVGDVNGVVTEPDYRRRGFGTAMTWAAASEGARRGCGSIVLSASEMGFPVYLRMGFTPVCRYRTYVPSEISTTSAGPAHAPTDS